MSPAAAPSSTPPGQQEPSRPVATGRRRGWRAHLARLLVLAALVAGLGTVGAGSAMAWPFDGCKAPPAPTAPSAGLVGSLDGGSAEGGSGSGQGRDPYGTYGYGGLEWSVYDLGCGGAVRDPGASIDTTFGNLFLGTAKTLFAAEQGMLALGSDSDVTDAVTTASSQAGGPVRDAIFSPWSGAALVIAATVIMLATRRGDIGEVVTRAGMVLLAITISALSFGSGAQLSSDLSGAIRSAINDATTKVAQEAFPAEAGGGDSPATYGMRNVVYRELLWKTWKDGEVGAAGSEDRAWQLFEQQALTRDEYQQVQGAASGGQEELFDAKGEKWMEVADAAPPLEYQAIQGKGDSRTAAGLTALAKIAPIALLQLFASIIQYMMYVFLAFLPVAAPLVALLAIVRPNVPEKAVKVVGAVIFGGIVASVVAMVHTIVILFLTRGDLNAWPSVLLIWVTTAVLYKIMKPIVSLTGILEQVSSQAGSIGSRIGRVSRWVRSERRFRGAVRVGESRHRDVIGALRGTPAQRPRPNAPGGGPGGAGGPSGGSNGPRPGGGPSPGGGPGPGGGGPGTGGKRPDGGGPAGGGPTGGGPPRPDGPPQRPTGGDSGGHPGSPTPGSAGPGGDHEPGEGARWRPGQAATGTRPEVGIPRNGDARWTGPADVDGDAGPSRVWGRRPQPRVPARAGADGAAVPRRGTGLYRPHRRGISTPRPVRGGTP